MFWSPFYNKETEQQRVSQHESIASFLLFSSVVEMLLIAATTHKVSTYYGSVLIYNKD